MMKRKPSTIEKLKAVKDFPTDGCTMAPDLDFADCCKHHDFQYSTTHLTRLQSDRQLRYCIKNKGYPILCWVYWLGVRLFGWIPYYFGKSYKNRKIYEEHLKNGIRPD